MLQLSFLALFICCGSSAHGNCLSSNYPKELVHYEPGTCDISLSNVAWIGYLNGILFVGHCPPGYCYYNESARIKVSANYVNHSTVNLNNMICSPMKRSGILCGKCVSGYGPAVNSKWYPCVSCTDADKTRNWLYYILAIYVPIVVMFLLILLCDVRLTTGAFNAFIIFGQVISATAFLSSFAQPKSIDKRLQEAYLIPYSVLNLNIIGNIIPNFCLSTDLNSLDAVCLKLLEASTPLITIIVVIVVLKIQICLKCNMSCHLCRKKRISFVHAFGAFIVLSYSRFCDVVSTLVDPGHLWGVNGTVVVRVYQYGEYDYHGKEFLPYKLVGFTLTAILCVIPLLMLQYPLHWLERICAKTKKTWYPSVLIGTILDVFQGCFKDNRRYFAGLYLILRLLLNFTPLLAMIPDEYLMQHITLAVFIMLLGILKPYKIAFYNYIDIMILTNLLLLIGVANGYELALYENNIEPSILVFAFQQVLIWLPLVCYGLYGTWKAMTLLKTFGWCPKCYIWSKALDQRKDASLPSQSIIPDDEFEQLFQRDDKN